MCLHTQKFISQPNKNDLVVLKTLDYYYYYYYLSNKSLATN